MGSLFIRNGLWSLLERCWHSKIGGIDRDIYVDLLCRIRLRTGIRFRTLSDREGIHYPAHRLVRTEVHNALPHRAPDRLPDLLPNFQKSIGIEVVVDDVAIFQRDFEP